jgi:hypothetical protein
MNEEVVENRMERWARKGRRRSRTKGERVRERTRR